MRMKRRLVLVVTALALVSANTVKLSAQAAAASSSSQPKTAAAKSWTPPRTPDGHPDLQGIWSSATLTPLQRPEKLAGKEFFATPEEATAFEKTTLVEGDMDLVNGPHGEDDLTHRAYNQAWFDNGTHVGKTMRTSLVIDPRDGRIPPFTPEGRAKYLEGRDYAASHPSDGPEDRPLMERCVIYQNTGPPIIPDVYNNNYQIVQTHEHVMMMSEMAHAVRDIPLDGRPHLPKEIREWQGDSRGHWEGDTLVVDITNFEFNNKTRFGYAYDGLTDENLHVTERFTRTDADTIMYRATIDDPTMFVKPWTLEFPLIKQQGPLYEYACHEGNYAMTGILGGARADEAKSGTK